MDHHFSAGWPPGVCFLLATRRCTCGFKEDGQDRSWTEGFTGDRKWEDVFCSGILRKWMKMVNCWFGLVVWFPGIPLEKGFLLKDLKAPLESKITNPNQQFTTSWLYVPPNWSPFSWLFTTDPYLHKKIVLLPCVIRDFLWRTLRNEEGLGGRLPKIDRSWWQHDGSWADRWLDKITWYFNCVFEDICRQDHREKFHWLIPN